MFILFFIAFVIVHLMYRGMQWSWRLDDSFLGYIERFIFSCTWLVRLSLGVLTIYYGFKYIG